MYPLSHDLPYLEFHITDHCNLNCKGCTHFSPLAAETYLSINEFNRDIKRLSELFSNISRMRLLGGEPLLHPQVTDFIESVRRYFPKSNFTLVTNGILLPSMGLAFYEVLKKNNVGLDVTVYPLTEPTIPEVILRAKQYEIPIEFQDSKYFCRFLNTNGNSNKAETFRQCWVNYCTFLRDGKLYPCCLPALAHIVNKKFGWNIPEDGYINIHADVSANDILKFLQQPITACAYCSKPVWFPWELTKHHPEEWIV